MCRLIHCVLSSPENSEAALKRWKSQLVYSSYTVFAKLRLVHAIDCEQSCNHVSVKIYISRWDVGTVWMTLHREHMLLVVSKIVFVSKVM